jgi:hypothetical protein
MNRLTKLFNENIIKYFIYSMLLARINLESYQRTKAAKARWRINFQTLGIPWSKFFCKRVDE